jgi:hypothetical protein
MRTVRAKQRVCAERSVCILERLKDERLIIQGVKDRMGAYQKAEYSNKVVFLTLKKQQFLISSVVLKATFVLYRSAASPVERSGACPLALTSSMTHPCCERSFSSFIHLV